MGPGGDKWAQEGTNGPRRGQMGPGGDKWSGGEIVKFPGGQLGQKFAQGGALLHSYSQPLRKGVVSKIML